MKRIGLAIALWLLCGWAQAQDSGIVRIAHLRSDIAVPAMRATELPRIPQAAFQATGSTRKLAPARNGHGWWRLQPADVHGPRMLLVYHPYSARITVLAPPDYRVQTQTMFDAQLDPRFSRRALAFPLLADGPVYVGVEDARYPLQVAVRATDQVIADDLVHVRVISVVTGVLAGISLMVMLFWALLRERVYLLYAATMALQLLYLLCAYGEAYALPGLRALAQYGAPGIWAIATLATAIASFFLIELAELKQHAPLPGRLLRWIGGYGSLLLLALLLSPWPREKSWFPVVGNVTLLVANAVAVLGLGVAWWRGNRRSGYAMLAWLPLVALSTARAVQLSAGTELTPMIEYGLPVVLALASILLVLVLADRALTVRDERDRARLHAEHDALTGVLNRSGIEQRLDWSIAQARRDDQALSVLYLDLDLFKRINDDHGHAVGDACLRALVRVAAGEMKYGDQLGRLGGEEFLLVLPGSNHHEARDLAERIRRRVESECADVADLAIALTVSIGVAQCGIDDTRASLIARADLAMYAAKHGGRNRVVGPGVAAA